MLLSLLVTMVTVAATTSARCMCNWKCCSELCQKVLLWIILLTVCGASNVNNITPTENEEICKTISPREAYFLEGEDIVLTCTGKNADSLTFARGSNSDIVPEEFIHKLNDSAIKLVIPNVTAKDIDSINDSIPYKCVNKYNTTQCYDNVHLRLEYYPREPQDLECRDYDFNEMTCTWSLGVEYHQPANINVRCEIAKFMYKSVMDERSKASWAACPSQNRTACHWNSTNYLAPYLMYAKVSVTAIHRNITKETVIKFYQHNIVEPGPVKELRVGKSIKAGRCVELDWVPTDKYRSFKFVITYSSNCTDEKIKTVYYMADRRRGDEKFDNRAICGLIPYTDYTYSVRGRLIEEKEVDNKTYVERGHWSKASSLTARTDSDVIDVNPETVAGLYEISSITRPGLKGYDLLHLYWTPLAECDLHDAADSVTYKVTAYNRTVLVTHPAFIAQIDIPESKIVNVTLQASNNVGHPGSARLVTVFPGIFGPHPSELIVQYNNTDDDCVTHVDVVVTEKGTGFSQLSHTLVWCRGTQLSCQKQVNWERFGVNVTSFVLPGNLCNVDYRYGLVTHGYSKGQGQIVDTGIHWEPCMYQLGKVVDMPVENANFTTIQPDNGFSVVWRLFSCKDMKAYITHYQVIYCIGDGQDDCTCTEDKVSVNVSRRLGKYTASDLQAGSLICVWIRGVSKAGVGPANKKALVHKISAQTGTLITLLILLAVFGAVLPLLVVGFCIARRKWKQYRRDASKIRIPNLDPQNDYLLQPDPGNDSGLTIPGYFSPDSVKNDLLKQRKVDSDTDDCPDDMENARKYSLHDITDVLVEEPSMNVPPGGKSQPEDISNDETDGQDDSLPSYTKAEPPGHTFTDKPINEGHDCHESMEGKKLVERGGATYLVADKVEPGHCRYSISSELSEAHPVNHSIEDLLWELNIGDKFEEDSRLLDNIAHESVELTDFLSPCENLCTTKYIAESPKTEKEKKFSTETYADKLDNNETEEYKRVDYAKAHIDGNNGFESGSKESSKKGKSNRSEKSVTEQNTDNNSAHEDDNVKASDLAITQTEKNEAFEKSNYKPFHVACHNPIEEQSDNENQKEVRGINEELGSAREADSIESVQLVDGQYKQIKDLDKLSVGGNKSSLLEETENETEVVKASITGNASNATEMRNLNNLETNQDGSLSGTKDSGIKDMDHLSSIDGSVESIGSETDASKEEVNTEGSVEINSNGEVEKDAEQIVNIPEGTCTMTNSRGLVPNGTETFPNGHRASDGSDTSSELHLPNATSNSLDNSGASSDAPTYVKADQDDFIKELQNEKQKKDPDGQKHSSKSLASQSNCKTNQNKEVNSHENGMKNGITQNFKYV